MVSSNPKKLGINKWRFFIKSRWFCWKQFPSTIFVSFFADKCLKMKFLIDLCTQLSQFLKIWILKKKITDLHILSCRDEHRSLCRVGLRVKEPSLLNGHEYRSKLANFDLCSALMVIEQWGFFNVPHLLRHGPTVCNGHLRGPVTLTPVAERLAVEPSLPVFTN